jgi:DNA uptake protein ComE-like DNA-binding protein
MGIKRTENQPVPEECTNNSPESQQLLRDNQEILDRLGESFARYLETAYLLIETTGSIIEVAQPLPRNLH